MILRVGFGIRLRRRLLRLRNLAVRRGQVGFRLRDVLPRLRQIGLSLRERLIRRIKTSLIRLNVLLRLRQLRGIIPQRGVRRADGRLVRPDVRLRGFKSIRRGRLSGLIRDDVLPRLIELGRIVLQSRLVVSQILLDSFDLFRRHRRRDRHRGDCRPVGTVASMIHGTQRIGVSGAGCQTGHEIVARTGLGGADDGHAGRIDALADLDMVEVRFHLSASACPAVPVDGHHAKLGRQYRLGRYGAWRRVGLDGGHENARPFAELVRIRRDCPDPDLDLRAAIQASEAKLRLIGRAGGMPGRAIHVLTPLNGVIANLNGGIVRCFGHGGPHGGRQSMGIPVRADIRVRLHDQSERGFRHAMVTVGRGGRAALTAGQRGATGDALDLLRLTDRSVILDVVQRDGRAQALALAHAQVDFLHAHLLAVADGGCGDPVAGVIVDERQTVHLADDQIARVLASHSRSIIQSALHECLSGVLVRHATLAAVGFPLAPRGRSSRIVHAEKQIVVALHEDRRREIADTLLVWGLADITRKLEYDLLAQVAAQCRAVGVPHLERPTGGAPVAAATIDQRAQYGLQVGSEAVVKRVFLRPCRAARVLRGVEAERQAGGHAATRLVLVQQGLEDRTRIRTVKRPFALVVAVREQMAGIVVFRL